MPSGGSRAVPVSPLARWQKRGRAGVPACLHAATKARTVPPCSGTDLHGVGLFLLPNYVDAGSPQQPRSAAGTCRRTRW